MNLIAMAAVGAATLAFGPGFLVQAGIGYVVGSACGAYCENRMKRLHREICRRTGDSESMADDLGKYAVKASQIGGVICPAIPLISAGVGVYCSHKADRVAALPCGDGRGGGRGGSGGNGGNGGNGGRRVVNAGGRI